MEAQELATKIVQHAYKNYAQDGWDFLIETYDHSDVVEEIVENDLNNFEDCLSYFGEKFQLFDEMRDEF